MYCSAPLLPPKTPCCRARRLTLLTPLSHPQSLKRATTLIQPSLACCLQLQPRPLGISADESHLGEATLVVPLTMDKARSMMQMQVAATYEAVQRAWASSHIPVANVDTHLQSMSLAFSIPENLHQPPISSNMTVIPIPSHPPLPMLHDADISRDC